MKIPQQLPRFEGQKILIAATSRLRAVFYTAGDGEINEAEKITVNPPQYSDREGFFARRGRGKTLGSGAVYERRKEKINHEFVPTFIKTLKRLVDRDRIDNIYLISPGYQMDPIKSGLPKTLLKMIALALPHNYCGRHPTEILEKIQEHLVKPIVHPEKEEAVKILNRRTTKKSR